MVTVCVPRYVPAAGLNVGVAVACWLPPLLRYVHVSIFWLAGSAACAAGESHVSGVASEHLRNVDRPALAEGRASNAIGDGHRQRGAVVRHVHGECVAVVKVDARAGQIHERRVGRGAILVNAGGIVAFSIVVIQIEFYGHAFRHAGVTEASASRTEDVAGRYSGW